MHIETKAIFAFTLIGMIFVIPFIASTFESSSSSKSLTPTGMILEAVSQEPNSTVPMMTSSSFGPESYENVIQTPYGKFSILINYEQITYGLESFERKIFVTERADMINQFYSTKDYNLNITRTPEKITERFSNSRGWIEFTNEGGSEHTTYYGANFSYLEDCYADAMSSFEAQLLLLEQVKGGAASIDSSYTTNTEDIYINEFVADPGVNGTEWVELYNNESYDLDLEGWVLDDEAGGSSPYTILSGTVIPSKGFVVLYGNETKVQLNNNGDTVRLIDPSGILADSYTYSSSEENVSIGRVPDGSENWVSITTPSPGVSNS